MAELLWGPEDMLQAECRAHRLNSERVVDVEYLLVYVYIFFLFFSLYYKQKIV